MKSRCSFILKAGLAIVLCFILLVGTMTVGLAAIRDELASTGWDGTGKNNISISFDGGKNFYTFSANTDGWINFKVPQTCLCKWEYYVEIGGTAVKFLKLDSDDTPSSDDMTSSDSEYWARKASTIGDAGHIYEATLTAGWYVIKFDELKSYGSDTNGSLKYYWYRKVVKARGDITGGWDKYYELTYDDQQAAYFYEITGDGNDKHFRIQRGDNGTYKMYQPYSGNFNLKAGSGGPYDGSTDAKKYGADNGDTYSFYFPTTSGTKYRVWFSTDWNNSNKVWYTEVEDLTTTDYYFGDDSNSWGGTHTEAKKFTKNGDGTYSYRVSLTNDYEFCIQSTGGRMLRMNAKNAWEVQSGNVGDNSTHNMSQWSDTFAHNLKWKAGSGEFILTLDTSDFTIKFDRGNTYYYLTGYLNNGSESTKGNTFKFLDTDGDGKYNLQYAFTDDSSGFQYITVTTNFDESYHPVSNYAGSGGATNATTDSTPVGDTYKWRMYAPSGMTVTFTWDTTTTPPTLTWAFDTLYIIAKDGVASSETTNTAKYGFGHIADTTLTVGGSAVGTSHDAGASGTDTKYLTTIQPEGTAVTVKTTIAEDYTTKYVVRGWSVNGVTMGSNASKTVNDDGEYSFTYTVPVDAEVGCVEITPIIYLANTYASTNSVDLVTFYVDGYSGVSDTWGNTPYAYPYYGNNASIANAYGVYPGQPLVYEDGRYSIEVPINSVCIDETVKVNATTGAIDASGVLAHLQKFVKGVVINNGYDDVVHKAIYGWSSDADHRQTYDADSFYKIYKEQTDSQNNSPNFIEMSIISGKTNNNRDDYGTAVPEANETTDDDAQTWSYTATNNTPKASLTPSDVTTISGKNGWTLLTDRYGRTINIFGEIISDGVYSAEYESAHEELRVISTGYSSNIAGDYGTAWLVYTPNAGVGDDDYTLVKQDTSQPKRYGIPPSIFAMKTNYNTTLGTYVFNETYPTISGRTVDETEDIIYSDAADNYLSMYNTIKSGYSDCYVYISYEGAHQIKDSDGGGAYRYDTQWHWSYATDKVSASVSVEYWNGRGYVAESSYVTGTGGEANQGAATGCQAYLTNESLDGKNFLNKTLAEDVLINTGSFSFTQNTINAGGRYNFVGWYLKGADGNYTLISKENSASTPASGNAEIVARYMLVTSGELTITHTLAAGSVGSADTHTSVSVTVHATGKAAATYPTSGTASSVTIPSTYLSNTDTDGYVDVTLTTTVGEYRFFNGDGFGMDGCAYTENSAISIGVDTVTYSFKIMIGALFDGSTMTYPSLAYTSPIAEIPIRATYYFTYPARTGGDVTSTVTGGLLTRTEYNRGSSPALNTSLAARQTDISSVFANKVKIFMQKGEVNPSIGAVAGTTVPVTFTMTNAAPRLTYYYPASASETAVAINGSDGFYKAEDCLSDSVENAYATAPDLSSIMSGKGVSGKQFYAWYEYDTKSETIGDMVSVEKQFGFSIAKDTTVIAVYNDSAFSSDGSWYARIDKNEVTVEPGNAYYNDNLVCFTNYRNTRLSTVTSAVSYGVVLLYRPTDYTDYTGNLSDLCTQENLKKFAALDANKHYKKSNSYRVINVTLNNDLTKLSNKNRAIISLQSGYTNTFKGAEYAAVSYVKIGESYSFSPARTGYYEVVE